MNESQTSGLASYQQTVYQTPGFASSIWPQGTSLQSPLIVVQITPIQFEKKDKEPLEKRTA